VSRTDKDVPIRVRVMREGVESHDHRFGECDFSPTFRRRERLPLRGWRYRQTCGLEMPHRQYSFTLKFYSRSKLQGWFAGEFYDRDSARLRKETGEIMKLHRAGEDIEFEDIWSGQHRHSAEWEVW
jgi:hypothetical protein